MSELQGRRIADRRFFDGAEPEPGDYGRMWVEGQGWRWFVCLPNGTHGVLDPAHVVTENKDGSISVSPSIENKARPHSGEPGGVIVGVPEGGGPPITDTHSHWHGYLVDGVWRDA